MKAAENPARTKNGPNIPGKYINMLTVSLFQTLLQALKQAPASTQYEYAIMGSQY
jgi:hypothetical protein